MITGFNPTDMYAADHIRRVLKAFPGVFTGIGEFSIHKEFVSAKVSGGGVASLQDPALDRILDFAGEIGLVVLLHNDVDVPFAKEGSPPAYLEEVKGAFPPPSQERPIIWAHIGVGRIVRPFKEQGRVHRGDDQGSGVQPCLLRHFVERGREVCRRDARVRQRP